MEAHVAFFNNKLRVGSYGAGRFVRLPVPGSIEGKSFEFGTPYDSMLSEFVATADAKTQDFYRRTKLLDILRRNGQIKVAPERWQDASFEEVAGYDVVVCFEQRIFDAVCEDLQSREARDLEPICVICMETKDDPKEAVVAGKATVKLAQKVGRRSTCLVMCVCVCVCVCLSLDKIYIRQPSLIHTSTYTHTHTAGRKRRLGHRCPRHCRDLCAGGRTATALPNLLLVACVCV
jgi:RNA polymerase II subunit A C-terminal domain phosphatase SSU72